MRKNRNVTTPQKDITDIEQNVSTIDSKMVDLYDDDGELLKHVKLSPNSDWSNDKKMVLDGVTYYRVATNTWVKADDVYVYIANNSIVIVYSGKYAKLSNASNNILNRALEKSTAWITDRYTMFDDVKYYRVATNEFVSENEVYEYVPISFNVITGGVTTVFNEKGRETDVLLLGNTEYRTDAYQIINNQKYYRISTNGFVKSEDVSLI